MYTFLHAPHYHIVQLIIIYAHGLATLALSILRLRKEDLFQSVSLSLTDALHNALLRNRFTLMHITEREKHHHAWDGNSNLIGIAEFLFKCI